MRSWPNHFQAIACAIFWVYNPAHNVISPIRRIVMVFPKRKHIIPLSAGLFCSFGLSGGASNYPPTAVGAAPAPTPPEKAVFSTYKGVGLGMKADEARKILGSPKDKSEAQDFYVLSDNETAQIYYESGAVTAISIDYSGDLKNAPSCKQVLGEEVPPKPDGGIYKLVRFPKAGFWVSFSKTAGTNPVVSITIQKL